jgi:hypothetical protein
MYLSWVKMLGSVRSRPLALKQPIQKATMRWLLAWSCVAGSASCVLADCHGNAGMHAGELGRLLAGCDLWFYYLASFGVPGFEGTCSVHIDRRKNDTVRKGHYPTLGRSKDPALDIVAQRWTWLRVAGLAVHWSCAKRARPLGPESQAALRDTWRYARLSRYPASLSVASLVTCLARPRDRVFVPKCPESETAPLPDRGCHTATGARIVPWWQTRRLVNK